LAGKGTDVTDKRDSGRRRGVQTPRSEMVGLATRRIAVRIIDDLLRDRKPVDDAFDAVSGDPVLLALNVRDRAFIRNLVATTVRRLGLLRQAVGVHLKKRLPPRSGPAEAILMVSAAQILVLDTADHAAVDQAVRLAAEDRNARHFRGLVNGVLRNLIRDRDAGKLPDLAAEDALPGWLVKRWRAAHGPVAFSAMADALLNEPPLDLTPKPQMDAEAFARSVGGSVLANGSIRLLSGVAGGPETLPGYEQGDWWVQDAAATLPVKLLGDVSGQRVADIAAAPGGKTAQLAANGARVTAIDRSAGRLKRLQENMTRLGLTAEIVKTDAESWSPSEPYDAVLLDAPCSATGTLRRHPDIAWIRRPAEIAQLAVLQRKLLANVAKAVKPGGLLVYATCSLEPEEGAKQVHGFLSEHPEFERMPIEADEIGGLADAITSKGDVQTRPDLNFLESDGGMDGFFMSRLKRRSD
jgi:16S rRNA (cytosine967-C5)-methyltransferase